MTDNLTKETPLFDIEAIGRLVEQEHIRLMDDSTGNTQPLDHSPGKSSHLIGRPFRHSDHAQCLRDQSMSPSLRHQTEPRRILNEFTNLQSGRRPEVLWKHPNAHLPGSPRGPILKGNTINTHETFAGDEEPRKHAKECRLAGAVGPQKSGDARPQFQSDVLQGVNVAEANGHALQTYGHTSHSAPFYIDGAIVRCGTLIDPLGLRVVPLTLTTYETLVGTNPGVPIVRTHLTLNGVREPFEFADQFRLQYVRRRTAEDIATHVHVLSAAGKLRRLLDTTAAGIEAEVGDAVCVARCGYGQGQGHTQGQATDSTHDMLQTPKETPPRPGTAECCTAHDAPRARGRQGNALTHPKCSSEDARVREHLGWSGRCGMEGDEG